MAKRKKVDSKASDKSKAVKLTKAERKEMESLIADYMVDNNVTKSLKAMFTQEQKAIATQRDRVLKIGKHLKYVKADVFGNDTKLYGAWLLVNNIDVTTEYSSYYIKCFENEKLAKEIWAMPKNSRMASAQSTARAISKALKPEPEEKPLDLSKRSKARLVADLKQILAKLENECMASDKDNDKIVKELESIGDDIFDLQQRL